MKNDLTPDRSYLLNVHTEEKFDWNSDYDWISSLREIPDYKSNTFNAIIEHEEFQFIQPAGRVAEDIQPNQPAEEAEEDIQFIKPAGRAVEDIQPNQPEEEVEEDTQFIQPAGRVVEDIQPNQPAEEAEENIHFIHPAGRAVEDIQPNQPAEKAEEDIQFIQPAGVIVEDIQLMNKLSTIMEPDREVEYSIDDYDSEDWDEDDDYSEDEDEKTETEDEEPYSSPILIKMSEKDFIKINVEINNSKIQLHGVWHRKPGPITWSTNHMRKLYLQI